MRWKISNKPEDYVASIKYMESEVNKIARDDSEELIWLLDYPSLYTSGIMADPADLLNKNKFPIYLSNRGGKYTYHGPGQRVVYTMINLNKKNKDVGNFVRALEDVIIGTLNEIGIKSEKNDNHHGVFIKKPNNQLHKIASIGCRFRKWVSYHGFSINHNPTLEHYSGINPCGLSNKNVTSIADLGINIKKNELDLIIKENLSEILNL